MKVQKMQALVEKLQLELVEAGKELSHHRAIAEVFRLKIDAASTEFSQLKGAMVQARPSCNHLGVGIVCRFGQKAREGGFRSVERLITRAGED